MALVPPSSQGGGGAGTVTSVTAADTSIVVAGTAAAPTIATATLDVIAADHPPVAAVGMNAQKITSQAPGTASTDGASFGQLTAFMPTGAVLPFAASAAPSAAWLLCDGSAVSRTTQAALFAVIATTYGVGDGTTTFNLPDMRGRMPAGYAASGGNADVATLGLNDGVAVANRRPKHNSSITDPQHSHTFTGGTPLVFIVSGGDTAAPGAGTAVTNRAMNAAATGITAGPTGTNPIDTPAYLVLNYLIKT